MRKVQLRLSPITVRFIADTLERYVAQDPLVPDSQRIVTIAHYLRWRADKVTDAERTGEHNSKVAS